MIFLIFISKKVFVGINVDFNHLSPIVLAKMEFSASSSNLVWSYAFITAEMFITLTKLFPRPNFFSTDEIVPFTKIYYFLIQKSITFLLMGVKCSGQRNLWMLKFENTHILLKVIADSYSKIIDNLLSIENHVWNFGNLEEMDDL